MLRETAERLSESHPDAAGDLQNQGMELKETWDDLLGCTEDRKHDLNEARQFYTFLNRAR